MFSCRIFKNADVVTMNPDQPRADAFLVCGDRFAAVGSLGDVRRRSPSGAEEVDLKGRTVLKTLQPGRRDQRSRRCHRDDRRNRGANL